MIGAILAEYRILEELGGQSGTQVYKAIGFDSRRPVAIKLFPAELSRDKSKIQALFDSLRIVARLDQPGIPRLIGSGLTGGRAYVIMPFMTGGSLLERLEVGQISPADAGSLLDKIASVLERIHALGMAHGHLSPSEVMFDNTGQIQIIGLGQAPFVVNGSNPPEMKAESEHLAPEVRNGTGPTPASDQYSMAVLAFELLTGQPVHAALESTALGKSNGGSLSALKTRLAPGVVAVLQRALEDDPSRRFATVGEMVRGLHEAIRAGSSQTRALRPSLSASRVSLRVGRSLGWGVASVAVLAVGCFALTLPAMAAARWMGLDLQSMTDLFSNRQSTPTVAAVPDRSHVSRPELPSFISTPTFTDRPQAILPTPGGNADEPEPTDIESSIENGSPDQPAPTESPTLAQVDTGDRHDGTPQPGGDPSGAATATPTGVASSTAIPNDPQQASPTAVPPQATPTGQTSGSG